MIILNSYIWCFFLQFWISQKYPWGNTLLITYSANLRCFVHWDLSIQNSIVFFRTFRHANQHCYCIPCIVLVTLTWSRYGCALWMRQNLNVAHEGRNSSSSLHVQIWVIVDWKFAWVNILTCTLWKLFHNDILNFVHIVVLCLFILKYDVANMLCFLGFFSFHLSL